MNCIYFMVCPVLQAAVADARDTGCCTQEALALQSSAYRVSAFRVRGGCLLIAGLCSSPWISFTKRSFIIYIFFCQVLQQTVATGKGVVMRQHWHWACLCTPVLAKCIWHPVCATVCSRVKNLKRHIHSQSQFKPVIGHWFLPRHSHVLSFVTSTFSFLSAPLPQFGFHREQ